jgi:hypothetical protein
MFIGITGQDTVALLQDLLTSSLAHELTSAGSTPSTHPQCRLEDLPEPAQFIIQFADALQPMDIPTPIEDDPSSLWWSKHLHTNHISDQWLLEPLEFQTHTDDELPLDLTSLPDIQLSSTTLASTSSFHAHPSIEPCKHS